MYSVKKLRRLYRISFLNKTFRFLKKEILSGLETIGYMAVNLYKSFKSFFSGSISLKHFLEHSARFGVDSLPIALLMVTITGMIIAIQVALEMVKQGAGDYVGMLVSLSMIRELGPVIGSFAVISLVGSSMAAEISTMKVTEQIDAMKVIGVDPINYLIAPRVFAGFFIMPFVIILANLMGILGGMFMSKIVAELNAITYINSVWIGLTLNDINASLVKSFIFGGLISLTCSSIGYKAQGGAIEVGKATTSAVVWSFLLVLLVDYFISFLFFGTDTVL